MKRREFIEKVFKMGMDAEYKFYPDDDPGFWMEITPTTIFIESSTTDALAGTNLLLKVSERNSQWWEIIDCEAGKCGFNDRGTWFMEGDHYEPEYIIESISVWYEYWQNAWKQEGCLHDGLRITLNRVEICAKCDAVTKFFKSV